MGDLDMLELLQEVPAVIEQSSTWIINSFLRQHKIYNNLGNNLGI